MRLTDVGNILTVAKFCPATWMLGEKSGCFEGGGGNLGSARAVAGGRDGWRHLEGDEQHR